MTPPQVSGVSLAPVQELEFSNEKAKFQHSVAGVQQHLAQHHIAGNANGRLVKKPAPLKMAGQGQGSQGQETKDGLRFWAEGKALQRTQAAAGESPKEMDPTEPTSTRSMTAITRQLRTSHSRPEYLACEATGAAIKPASVKA
eukprot:gene26064-11767_t